jgi:hypothetical protein
MKGRRNPTGFRCIVAIMGQPLIYRSVAGRLAHPYASHALGLMREETAIPAFDGPLCWITCSPA